MSKNLRLFLYEMHVHDHYSLVEFEYSDIWMQEYTNECDVEGKINERSYCELHNWLRFYFWSVHFNCDKHMF